MENLPNFPNGKSCISNINKICTYINTTCIVDNSTISNRYKTFKEVTDTICNNILVVESGTKFISPNLMSGVVYGNKKRRNIVRKYARDTGQLLQGRAMAFLDEVAIRIIEDKVSIHDRNSKAFMNILTFQTSNFTVSGGINSSIIYNLTKKVK